MAIHAKKSGMMISVRILEDAPTYWHIHAVDEKRPKYIQKDDEKNKVFDGESAVDDAMNWIEASRK